MCERTQAATLIWTHHSSRVCPVCSGTKTQTGEHPLNSEAQRRATWRTSLHNRDKTVGEMKSTTSIKQKKSALVPAGRRSFPFMNSCQSEVCCAATVTPPCTAASLLLWITLSVLAPFYSCEELAESWKNTHLKTLWLTVHRRGITFKKLHLQ